MKDFIIYIIVYILNISNISNMTEFEITIHFQAHISRVCQFSNSKTTFFTACKKCCSTRDCSKEARIFFSQYQIQQRESICARLRGLHIQHKHQEQNRELVIMKMIIMLFTSTFNISSITEITKIDKEFKSFPLSSPKLQKTWQATRVELRVRFLNDIPCH